MSLTSQIDKKVVLALAFVLAFAPLIYSENPIIHISEGYKQSYIDVDLKIVNEAGIVTWFNITGKLYSINDIGLTTPLSLEKIESRDYENLNSSNFSDLTSKFGDTIGDLFDDLPKLIFNESFVENHVIKIYDERMSGGMIIRNDITHLCLEASGDVIITNDGGNFSCSLNETSFQEILTSECIYLSIDFKGDREYAATSRKIRRCTGSLLPFTTFKNTIASLDAGQNNGAENFGVDTKPMAVCIPIVILFGLFIVSMYYAGKSPITYFDIMNTRIPKFSSSVRKRMNFTYDIQHRLIKVNTIRRMFLLKNRLSQIELAQLLEKVKVMSRMAGRGRLRGTVYAHLNDPTILNIIKRDIANGKITNMSEVRRSISRRVTSLNKSALKGKRLEHTDKILRKQTRYNEKMNKLNLTQKEKSNARNILSFSNLQDRARFLSDSSNRVRKKLKKEQKEAIGQYKEIKKSRDSAELFDGDRFDGPLNFLSEDKPLGHFLEKLRISDSAPAKFLRPITLPLGSDLLFFRKGVLAHMNFARLFTANLLEQRADNIKRKVERTGFISIKDEEKYKKFTKYQIFFEGDLKKKVKFANPKNYYEDLELQFNIIKYAAYRDIFKVLLYDTRTGVDDAVQTLFKEIYKDKMKTNSSSRIAFQETIKALILKLEERNNTLINNDKFKFLKTVSEEIGGINFSSNTMFEAQRSILDLYNLFNSRRKQSEVLFVDLQFLTTINRKDRKNLEHYRDVHEIYKRTIYVDEFIRQCKQLVTEGALNLSEIEREKRYSSMSIEMVRFLSSLKLKDDSRYLLSKKGFDLEKRIYENLNKEGREIVAQLFNSSEGHKINFVDLIPIDRTLFGMYDIENRTNASALFEKEYNVRIKDASDRGDHELADKLRTRLEEDKYAIFNLLNSNKLDTQGMLDRMASEKMALYLMTDSGLNKVRRHLNSLNINKDNLSEINRSFLSSFNSDTKQAKQSGSLFHNVLFGGTFDEDWKVDMQHKWKFLKTYSKGGVVWDESRSIFGQIYGRFHYALTDNYFLKSKDQEYDIMREESSKLLTKVMYENYLNGEAPDAYTSAKGRIMGTITEMNALYKALKAYKYEQLNKGNLDQNTNISSLSLATSITDKEFREFMNRGTISHEMARKTMYGQAQEGYGFAIDFEYKTIGQILKESDPSLTDDEIEKKVGARKNTVLKCFNKGQDVAEFDVNPNEKTAYVDYNGELKNITPAYMSFNNKELDKLYQIASDKERIFKNASAPTSPPNSDLHILEKDARTAWETFYKVAEEVSKRDNDKNDYVAALYKGAYMNYDRNLRSDWRVEKLLNDKSVLLLSQNEFFNEIVNFHGVDNTIWDKTKRFFSTESPFFGKIPLLNIVDLKSLDKIKDLKEAKSLGQVASTIWGTIPLNLKQIGFNQFADARYHASIPFSEAVISSFSDTIEAGATYTSSVFSHQERSQRNFNRLNQGRINSDDFYSSRFFRDYENITNSFTRDIDINGNIYDKDPYHNYNRGWMGSITYNLMRDKRAGYRRGGFTEYFATGYYLGQGHTEPPDWFTKMGSLTGSEKLHLNLINKFTHEQTMPYVAMARTSSMLGSGIISRFDTEQDSNPSFLNALKVHPFFSFLTPFGTGPYHATKENTDQDKRGYFAKTNMSGRSHLAYGAEKNYWEFHRYYKNFSSMDSPIYPGLNYEDMHANQIVHPRFMFELQNNFIQDEYNYKDYFETNMDIADEEKKERKYIQIYRRNADYSQGRSIDRTALGFAIDEDVNTLRYSLFNQRTDGKGMLSFPRLLSLPILSVSKIPKASSNLADDVTSSFNNNFNSLYNKLSPSTKTELTNMVNQTSSSGQKYVNELGLDRTIPQKITSFAISSANSVGQRLDDLVFRRKTMDYKGKRVMCRRCGNYKTRYSSCSRCGV